jgi:hypothetical protein
MVDVLWLGVTQNLRHRVAFFHITGKQFNPDRQLLCGRDEVGSEHRMPATRQQAQQVLADEPGGSCH